MTGQTIILGSRYERQKAHELIDAAPVNAVCNIKEPTRSLPQNDRLWAMLSDVSRAKPQGRRHTPDMWKALFMKACGHHVQFLEGLDGEPFPVGFRSSRLSVRQMTELMDFIDAWGTEQGVQWSDKHRSAA